MALPEQLAVAAARSLRGEARPLLAHPLNMMYTSNAQADVIALQETQYTTMVSTFWPKLSAKYHVLHSTPYEGAQFALEMTKASFVKCVYVCVA